MESNFLWRLEVRGSYKAAEAIGEVFEKTCIAVSLFENKEDPNEWRVEGYTEAAPDKIVLAREISQICLDMGETPFSALRCEFVQPRDWLALNVEQLQPTQVGRFFIHGSHFDFKVPPGCTQILLGWGTAFGSGEHGSTAGCLGMIEKLSKARRFFNPLDMGCGSGILAIAMAKTWPVSVVAVDLDLEAVRVTALNARRNGVAQRIECICSRGYKSMRVKGGGPYDLIVANIFTRPLVAMAHDLSRNLRRKSRGGGFVVLSGLLENDGRRVLAAHQPHGLRLWNWAVLDGWLTMVLRR